MGGGCSKKPDRERFRRPRDSSASDSVAMTQLKDVEFSGSEIRVESIHKDDLITVGLIKKELHENAPVFVLNNAFMAMQFFADHKDIITKMRHAAASPQEKEMNKTLLKDETVECTYPDTILDEVNKNIVYRPVEENSIGENLLAKRIYVINDLIEVVKSKEIPQYTSIDKPCYQVRIEESDRKGFVKLTQIQNNAAIFANREYDENYEPLPGPSSKSDSEYSYITELRTPKQIEVDTTVERRDTLPETCFTHRKVKCLPSEELDEDDEEERLKFLENLNEDDFIKDVIYVNSKGFMKYFQNTLFTTSLGKSLGFTEESIASAKAIPGKIFCDDVDIETTTTKTFEVIPAVGITWPLDQTYEFITREDRPTIVDRRTGIKYRWPTDGPGGMIDEIIELSAVLVPKGYAKKKGINVDNNLEWEMNFPKAERYLEARMSHAQMKSFLLLLTLHKSFIAPVTQQYGLLPEHIRTHMYWECEKDYRNWPEHRLGTKMLMVLNNLKKRLYVGILPDYFVKDKNLFENIPQKYLQYAQKVLLEVLENPVPYFISSLRNLRYTSGKFYPSIDLKDLFESLTTKNSAGLVNPKLLTNQRIPYLKKRVYKDPEQQIQHLREVKIKEKILAKRLKEKEDQLLAQKKEELEKKAKSDIDLEVKIEKTLDLWKTKSILAFFIKIFLDIAKKSYVLATKEQALFYLKQAYYLTRILEEESPAFTDEAKEWYQLINVEESKIKRKSLRSASISDSKPPTPVKNPVVQFQFDISPHAKTGSIKLNNLQASYLNGTVNGQAPPALRNLKPVQRNTSFKENGTLQHSNSLRENGVIQPPRKKTVAFVT